MTYNGACTMLMTSLFAHIQLDSTAFFPYLSFGANNEVAGIATLMAIADALGQQKKQVYIACTYIHISHKLM